VVNDGSPDTPELEKVLAPYLNRIVYVKQENKRTAGARNNAIRHARGEYVASSTAMTLGCPITWLRRCSCLTTTPRSSFTYSNGLVGERGQEREFMKGCPSAGEATFGSLLVERCQIPISTVVAAQRGDCKSGNVR